MADHIEAFELLAKGKGYITWRDIKSTMESTLQHTVRRDAHYARPGTCTLARE